MPLSLVTGPCYGFYTAAPSRTWLSDSARPIVRISPGRRTVAARTGQACRGEDRSLGVFLGDGAGSHRRQRRREALPLSLSHDARAARPAPTAATVDCGAGPPGGSMQAGGRRGDACGPLFALSGGADRSDRHPSSARATRIGPPTGVVRRTPGRSASRASTSTTWRRSCPRGRHACPTHPTMTSPTHRSSPKVSSTR